MWYDRSLGLRVDVGILGVVTVKSAVDCARRCHQHINCNNFNFRRKEIPECRNSSKSQEKQNHRKKMKNEYYPIVVTVHKSNEKNRSV
jgi:hypothetical protein